MDTKRILVVDDEPDIVELVSYNLKKEGFDVLSASDGEEALNKIRTDNYDLIILDLMLPGIQGTEICRILRNDPRTQRLPVIMLTAKGEEIDRILGLEIGADDYLTKPFSPRELAARIRAVLRRGGEQAPREKSIRLKDLIINLETYTVSKRGVRVDLSATEFRLLLYLVERRGKVFSREQLLDAVWKDEGFVEPRTVDVHVRRLRAQIEDDASEPAYIKTKRGIGYYVDADI
ncbi:MAG TPA: response regulator [Thermodesulfovibrionales bacterium]|nr:response regulator [Thermodesulfovibrionales bacterium]